MRSINKLFDRNGVEKTSVALNATTLQGKKKIMFKFSF